MAIISKLYKFEAAHQLEGHKGKCANLHGHSYNLEVFVVGSIEHHYADLQVDRSSDGMVLDYDDIDQVVKPLVDHLDHTFLNDIMQGRRSTAENLGCMVFAFLMYHFEKQGKNLHSVKIKETENTTVVIFREDYDTWIQRYPSSRFSDQLSKAKER